MKYLKQISIILSVMSFLQGNAQPLDELLRAAVDNNPVLKAIQLEYDAMLLEASQQKQLADPQIGMAAPILRPETRLGAQIFAVSAKQMFPWFGTLKAKEDVVLSMAKVNYEQAAIEKLNLFYQIKSAYYQLYLIDQKQNIIQENIRLYKTLERVALSKVESGKSIASDVLNIQIKTKGLENEVLFLENQKIPLFAEINQVIGRPLTDSISIEQSLDSVAYLDFDLSNYEAIIAAHHPLIKQLDWQLEVSEKKEALNKLSGMPTIGVGLDYTVVKSRSDAFPDHNGRDILIPKLSVNIPLNRKKYHAKYKEEVLHKEAINYRKENTVSQLLAQLQSFKTDYDNSVLQIELIKEQHLIAESAYSILLSEYSSSGNRFDELIQILDQLYSYKLNTKIASTNTYLVSAKIEKLTDF